MMAQKSNTGASASSGGLTAAQLNDKINTGKLNYDNAQKALKQLVDLAKTTRKTIST